MCGIAGVIGPSDTGRVTQTVSRMLAELERRGPDDGRMAAWNRAVIGARRLAVFDTTRAGAQPMLAPDLSVGVVFNGAIYNFRSLRGQLVSAGYQFRSHADTEVLLHGYSRWGIDGLVDRLDGMFAFCIWDERRDTAYLVRDRLGVKPLLYSTAGGTLAFASTAQALHRAGVAGELDPNAVLDYLDFGYVPDTRCVYSEVRKVPPATIVEWHDTTLSDRVYRTPPAISPGSGPAFDEAVEETERLLLRAVEKRLNADVRVGALLSGGIDSALVCWAVRQLGADIPVYTLGVSGAVDESRHAAEVAGTLGFAHEVIPLSLASEEPWELARAFAEPFACTSALGVLQISRHVKGRVTVVLTGDGGDDAFLGYPAYRDLGIAEMASRLVPAWTLAPWKRVRRMVPPRGLLRRATHFLDFATGGLPAVLDSQTRLPFYRKAGILGPRLVECLDVRLRRPWSSGSARMLMNDFQKHHLGNRFLGEFLPKIDGATSHESLEARSPFLDIELWDFAHSLPAAVRLCRGQPKAVLRELARRHLGKQVAVRRKRGFTVPLAEFLRDRWRGLFERSFTNPVLEREAWLTPGATLRHFSRADHKAAGDEQEWFLLILELWLRGKTLGAGNDRPIRSLPVIPACARTMKSGSE